MKKAFTLFLCAALASGCATTADHARHFTLVTFPAFALLGAATGALSAKK